MSLETTDQAFDLLKAFLRGDEYYLDSSAAYGDTGDAGLRRALAKLLASPELGFVWLAFLDGQAVAVCVISFAVSTSVGAVVAKMDDVYVTPDCRRRGVGAAHFAQLCEELMRIDVARIDTSVHIRNKVARHFYQKLGFESLQEERIAYLIDRARRS